MQARVVLFGLVSLTTPLAAQSSIDPYCPAGTPTQRATQDACQKAIDTFEFLAPQLGIAVTGGSATLGQGAAFGGFGKFSLGVRANVIPGLIPRVDRVTPSPLGATRTPYEVEEYALPFPTLDAALGVFPGLPMGSAGMKVLAVDVIANLSYIPAVTEQNVSITPTDGTVKLGFGARIGVVQENGAVPGLGLSYLRRDLPQLDVVARVNDDRLAVRSIAVESTAWRLMLQKSLSIVTFVLGAGRDQYNTAAVADVEVTVAGVRFQSSDIAASQSLTRDNVFADVAVKLSALKVAGEIGYVRGGSVATYNQFGSSRADRAHPYGSLGIRLAF